MSSRMVEVGQMDLIRRLLFKHAMRGEWQEVVEIYKTDPRAYHVKVAKSGDTALHIAVSDSKEASVEELVRIMFEHSPEQAKKALWLANAKEKNTPLHLVAALVRMCHCIARVDSSLVGPLNSDNEAPLFLAAAHGKKEAFLCLHHSCSPHQRHRHLYYRRNEGDPILHVAIAGEYFGEHI